MAREWTDAQRAAINTRDRTLLVSAAAGSGKTATLTERIICSILDENKPSSITDMLIVTFTNSAVGELRERIGAAVREALAKSPSNDRLHRELLMLPSAKICTIDAYCGELVRQNADKVGISPAYRILDIAEADLIKENILDGMISAIYEGEIPEIASAEEFDRLSDCLTDMKNQESIIKSIKYVYERTLNTDCGVESLTSLVDEYLLKDGIEGSCYYKYAVERLHDYIKHYTGALKAMETQYVNYGKKAAKQLKCIQNDLSILAEVGEAEGYEDIKKALARRDFLKSPGNKGLDFAPELTSLRDKMKKELEKIEEAFFAFTSEEWFKTAEELYALFAILSRFISHFHRVFLAEKMRRSSFEYSDIERFAYDCLWQGGERTELALAQAKMYTSIYIDEYQDINTIQAKIFEAVSKPDNCFMVGDIKQSIYGFRNANPTLFANLKNSYAHLGENTPPAPSSIFMSANFRCDKGIIDFTNSVFDRIFPHFPSVSYMSGDSLVYKKPQLDGEPPYRTAEVCAVCPLTKKEKEANPEMPEWQTEPAAVVAKKIKRLLKDGKLNDGTPIRPGDISILLRGRTNEAEYAKALRAEGIAVEGAEEKGFFENSDIELCLALLHAIDNPRRDTYLCGVMCSPIYSFTPGELVLISSEGEGVYLYDKLVSYSESHPEFIKGRDFIYSLKRLRMIAEGMTVDNLIARLYRECGIYSLCVRNGGADRLIKLYDYARSFESGTFCGLYSFLSYVDKIIERKNSFDDREAPTDVNAVRIQTVHSSKGLEYPIVFLCEAQAAYKSNRAASERLSYNENFGISMLLRTPLGLSRVANPMRAAVQDFSERREIEEEARILYVALTRARERLFVVGNPRKSHGSLVKDTSLAAELLSAYSVYSISSSLDMILTATGKSPMTPSEFVESEILNNREPAEDKDNEEYGGDKSRESENLYELLKERFSYVYPDKYITELPEKTAVSGLYPTVFDGNEEISVFDMENEKKEVREKGILPAFVTGIEKGTARKRGIATHLFMQFCDLERLVKEGAEAELSRLVKEQFISERDGERVRLDEIRLFLTSKLLREMRGAGEIWREQRFNVYLPAEEFTTEVERKTAYENEEVLVQGVIDCIYTDTEGKLHLVDYKTDRLTKEELSDKALAKQRLNEAHRTQLSYYAMAVERIFGKKPDTVRVYSLPLGDTVDIDL